MRPSVLTGCLAALLFLLLPSPSLPAEEILSLNTWIELEPMIQEGEEYPLSPEEALRRLLGEARRLLSGMIYGYSFAYTPPDRRRDIPEEFILEPIAEIPWADRNLEVLELEHRDNQLWVRIDYHLEDYQNTRRQAWSSNAIPLAGGRGELSLFQGPGQKLRSVQEAIKNAIRDHLRPIHFNQPREIRGELLIWEEPRTIIVSGNYQSRVTIKLKVKEVRSYRFF